MMTIRHLHAACLMLFALLMLKSNAQTSTGDANPAIARCPFYEFDSESPIENAEENEEDDDEREYILDKGAEEAVIRITREVDKQVVTAGEDPVDVYADATAVLTIQPADGEKVTYNLPVDASVESVTDSSGEVTSYVYTINAAADTMKEPYTATISEMDINNEDIETDMPSGCYDEVMTYGFGCPSCDCEQDPDVESVHYRMPVGKANMGDTISYLSYESESFQNQGAANLRMSQASGYTINRSNGVITSAISATVGAFVSPVTDAVDPKAFKVEFKHKSGNDFGIPFKTVIFKNVNLSGQTFMRISVTMDGATKTFDFEKHDDQTGQYDSVMSLAKAGGLWLKTVSKKEFEDHSGRVERTRIENRLSDGSYVAESDIEETFTYTSGREKRTRTVIDPSGRALVTKWEYYQIGEVTGPNGSRVGSGKVKRMVRHDGYVETRYYETNKETTVSSYAGDPQGLATVVELVPATKTTTTTRSVGSNVISKAVVIHGTNTVASRWYVDAANYLETTTEYHPSGGAFSRLLKKSTNPDGTVSLYEYGISGASKITTTYQGVPGGTNISEGTKTVRTVNASGELESEIVTAVCSGNGNGMVLSHQVVLSSDDYGRPLSTGYFPNSNGGYAYTTSKTYNCCGIDSETDRYGITTYYAYDDLKRPIKTNRLGVTTATKHDGSTVSTHRYPESPATAVLPDLSGATEANVISKTIKNPAGTVTESWSRSAADGTLVRSSMSTTLYLNPESAHPASLPAGIGMRKITELIMVAGETTAPTQTSDYFMDGKLYETFGVLSPAMRHTYSVNTTGPITSRSYVDGSDLRETTTTQSDWAGRTLCITYMDGISATNEYNTLGQLVKSTDPDGVTTLSAYNAKGERTLTATDLNANGQIDYGTDSVSFSETNPALSSGNPVLLTTTKVWQPGDTNPAGGTTISTNTRSPSGLSASSKSLAVANPSTIDTNIVGQGIWITTQTNPDGTKNVSTYLNGRIAASTRLDATEVTLACQSQGYDSLGRPETSTDSRTGTTTTHYLSPTTDVVTSTTDPGGRTTAYTYDVRGRRITVDAPDTLDAANTTLPNIITTRYFPDGKVQETNGAQTYLTTHTYDYAGRQQTLTTYGTETATNTWYYSPTRGFLTRKQYADGKGTDYTYTSAGRLHSRTWARGVVTTYGYDEGGRLTTTRYTDVPPVVTPDVTITYDALGRQTTVTQTNQSQIAYTYDPANLALETETAKYDIDHNGSYEFTRVLDRSRDTRSRDTGFELKNGTTTENQATYGYSPTDGRLQTIIGGGDVSSPQTFSYSYLPNSNLLSTISSPTHTVTNTWATDRDVLLSKQNKVGTDVISQYDYTVNALGQRTAVATSGTAFPNVPSWLWGYDSLGQVTSADSSNNNSDRAYEYDGIGNRKKSADSLSLPSTDNYTVNALNQYGATAASTVSPTYDFDGNMASGPLPADPSTNSTLVWDAENRLVSTTVGTTTKIIFYDAQSRRIAESTGTNTTLYVNDGWNCIAEYGGGILSKTRLWGLDLSGSLQGAGGVAGLLIDRSGSNSHFPTYDGNGNVSEYLASDGTIAGHFEYDAFGNTVANTDTNNQFSYRFSTKPLDTATGLYYYGYRWYDPLTGRWPSRDRKEELGGTNLLAFTKNSSINFVDILGNSAFLMEAGDIKGPEEDCSAVQEMKKFREKELLRLAELKKDPKLLEKATFTWVDGEGQKESLGVGAKGAEEWEKRVNREEYLVQESSFKNLAGDMKELEDFIKKLEYPYDVAAYYHHSAAQTLPNVMIPDPNLPWLVTYKDGNVKSDQVEADMSNMEESRLLHATCSKAGLVSMELQWPPRNYKLPALKQCEFEFPALDFFKKSY